MVAFPLAFEKAVMFRLGVRAAKLQETHTSLAIAKSQKTALERKTRVLGVEGGVLLYMGYMGMRGPTGHGFFTLVLTWLSFFKASFSVYCSEDRAINRVSVFGQVSNWVTKSTDFGHK